MSDGKMSPEKLEGVLLYVATSLGCGAADNLRNHIAALEKKRDDLQAQVDAGVRIQVEVTRDATRIQRERDAARKERDEAVRTGKQFHADSRKHFDQSCTNLQRAETAERERDAALADNAALLMLVADAVGCIHTTHLDMGGQHRFSVRNGPAAVKAIGAALALKPIDHPGAALLEEHRKALVLLGRVHPSVREILSEHEPSHRFHWSVRCMTCAPRNARERAMKEPE